MADFQKVRDSMSLAGFFETAMGGKIQNVAGGVRCNVCPACGASSTDSVKVSVRGQKWHCFSCGQKGDIIDAAASLWDMSPALAASELEGDNLSSYPTPVLAEPVVVKKDYEAIRRVINLLRESQRECDPVVAEYLKGRGIGEEVISEALEKGLMVTLPSEPAMALRYLLDTVGKELLVASGLWKEGSKTPAIVYRPLAFIGEEGNGIEFRLISPNGTSAKAIRYGQPEVFMLKGNEHFMVCEGAIDMLSARMLGSGRTLIGLPGAMNWESGDSWFQNLKGKHVLLCLDDDEAGKKAQEEMFEALTKLESFPKKYQHQEGCNDLNDALCR